MSRATRHKRHALRLFALLSGGVLGLQHLAATIGAAIRAGMVRLTGLAALRADGQLRQLDLVMRAAMALTRVCVTFLRQRAHGRLLRLLRLLNDSRASAKESGQQCAGRL